jgi:hypothetical protein
MLRYASRPAEHPVIGTPEIVTVCPTLAVADTLKVELAAVLNVGETRLVPSAGQANWAEYAIVPEPPLAAGIVLRMTFTGALLLKFCGHQNLVNAAQAIGDVQEAPGILITVPMPLRLVKAGNDEAIHKEIVLLLAGS